MRRKSQPAGWNQNRMTGVNLNKFISDLWRVGFRDPLMKVMTLVHSTSEGRESGDFRKSREKNDAALWRAGQAQ
jgi:hypothetical protein